jgi:predicted GIY-YIG superfamily endonuclease
MNDVCEKTDNSVVVVEEESWKFYIIINGQYTYAGVSPDPVKRLRKHNGEICGGAKYTTSKGSGWKHVCLIEGFQTKNQALQFEWAVKHVPPRNSGGIIQRLKKLYTVLNKNQWTSKSPLSTTVPLVIEWKMEKPIIIKELSLPNYITEKPLI